MGWNGEDYAVMQRMSHSCYSFSLQSIVQTIMRKVMEFLFRAASLVVDTIRTFFLIVLSVLGPIAFAISSSTVSRARSCSGWHGISAYTSGCPSPTCSG